ncbi:MAG: hypothetical protein R3F37_07650 [Candidatus Competibacteraceae bacterium]
MQQRNEGIAGSFKKSHRFAEEDPDGDPEAEANENLFGYAQATFFARFVNPNALCIFVFWHFWS